MFLSSSSPCLYRNILIFLLFSCHSASAQELLNLLWPAVETLSDYELSASVEEVYEYKEEYLFDQVPGFERISRSLLHFDSLGRLCSKERNLIIDSLNSYYSYDEQGRKKTCLLLRQKKGQWDSLMRIEYNYDEQQQSQEELYKDLLGETLARKLSYYDEKGRCLETQFWVLSAIGFRPAYSYRLYPKFYYERSLYEYGSGEEIKGYWHIESDAQEAAYYSRDDTGSIWRTKTIPSAYFLGFANRKFLLLLEQAAQKLTNPELLRGRDQDGAYISYNKEGKQSVLEFWQDSSSYKSYNQEEKKAWHCQYEYLDAKLSCKRCALVQRQRLDNQRNAFQEQQLEASSEIWSFNSAGQVSRLSRWFWTEAGASKQLKVQCFDRSYSYDSLHHRPQGYKLQIWEQYWPSLFADTQLLKSFVESGYEDTAHWVYINKDSLHVQRMQYFGSALQKDEYRCEFYDFGEIASAVHYRKKVRDGDSLELQEIFHWKYDEDERLVEAIQKRRFRGRDEFYPYRRKHYYYHPNKGYLQTRWTTDFQVLESEVPDFYYAEEFRHEYETINNLGWVEERYVQHRNDFQEYDFSYKIEYVVDEQNNWIEQLVWHESKLISKTLRRIRYREE